MREVRSLTEVEAFEAVVRDAAGRTAARLRNLPEDGLALLRHLKFELAGHHPLEPRPLNLIEQVNQTWTCLVSLKAARMLLERHPEFVGRLPVVDRQNPHQLVGYLGRATILAARLRRVEEEEVRESGWLHSYVSR
mgnify:CR=1 FL=1